MSYQAIQTAFNGFVEAMYFADGADADFKDAEGFYMDGQFNNQYDLSDQAKSNIKALLEVIIPKLPDSVYELTLDRVGEILYYECVGHGVSFSDDLDLSEDDENTLYQLFFNSVFIEVYDNEDTQEIEFSFTYNFN